MFEKFKAKNEAVDFYQLIQVCNGKQIKGFEVEKRNISNLTEEDISYLMEKVIIREKDLSYEVNLKKNLDGKFISASLTTCSKYYKSVKMITEDDDLIVTLECAKNNFNRLRIIEVRMDNNGRVMDTGVEKKDYLVYHERTGIAQDIMSAILRKVYKRKNFARAKTMRKSMCI